MHCLNPYLKTWFCYWKKGSDIEKIKKNIMKITDSDVNVNIKEIKKPEINSNLVAENIAQQLVKRVKLTEEQ